MSALQDADTVAKVEDRHAMAMKLKVWDEEYWGGKLSKTSVPKVRLTWARTEAANWAGLLHYFRTKLCKAASSPNRDMRDLKRLHFQLEASDNNTVGAAGTESWAEYVQRKYDGFYYWCLMHKDVVFVDLSILMFGLSCFCCVHTLFTDRRVKQQCNECTNGGYHRISE